MTGLRVQTSSRLHFGLLGWGPDAPRQFGGVGLMIEAPGLDVEVRPAPTWHAEGPLAARALAVARRVSDQLAEAGTASPALAIVVRSAAPEHAGLGTGTQLSLAIARAVLELAGRPGWRIDEAAELTGRGRRSGIGLHGFDRGGLIVDGGRGPNGEPPPLLTRLEFPRDWAILLVMPAVATGLSGRGELQAFRELRPPPPARIDRLCRLILLQMLPAVVEQDLTTFGAALAEIQEQVGRSFAPAQGGLPFAHPRLAEIAARMTRAGLRGVGQSSWGPTLYGFTDGHPSRFDELVDDLRTSFDLDPSALIWTHSCNQGVRMIRIGA